MTAPALAMDRVTVKDDLGRSVLNDMTLTIERGESVALVGHNGGGKTSALRLFAGMTAPTSGRVLVFGEDLARLSYEAQRRHRTHTGFVFEAFDRKGELRALAGGGRYDDLVGKLGGPALPAVGFAIGDMTFSLLLEQRGLMPTFVQAPDVYCVIGGAAGRQAAFADIHALRAAGRRVDYPMKDVAFGKQFKLAADSGAKLALIYGDDEVAKGTVKIRDLTDRSEHEVPRDHVQAVVRDFFSAG